MSTSDENVLLIAYGCEPGRGSEAGIGWANATATARERPTWVVVHPRHREALDRGVAEWNADPAVQRITPVYVDAAGLPRRWADAGSAGFNAHYLAWCRSAERAVVQLHDSLGFALAQHVSISRWWMPSPAAAVARRGAAFVWGPVGAGETMPPRFRRGIAPRAHLTEMTRWAAREVFRRDPRLRRCASLATLAAAEPAETANRFRELGCREVVRLMSLPCDTTRMKNVVPAEKPPGTFRVVSGGGLVYWKCFDLSVRAFAAAFGDVPNAEYVHVCDGRERAKVQRVAESLGVANRVRLLGDSTHLNNLRWVASADLYVLPAMRDTNGHIFEALSAGVPVLCADRLSPGATVDATCGTKIDLKRHAAPAAFVAEMARIMRLWHDDPALRSQLSDGAKRRAAGLDQDRFGEALRAVQARAISMGGSPAPARSPARSVDPTDVTGSTFRMSRRGATNPL